MLKTFSTQGNGKTMKKTTFTLSIGMILYLILGLTQLSFCANTIHKVLEPLHLKSPILKPIASKQALALALGLQKERQGLLSWMDLGPALQHSLNYAKAQPQHSFAISQASLHITWQQITQSLELLQVLLPNLDANPELLEQHFQWLHLTPRTHFTSYFSPVTIASRVQSESFNYPLYRLPEEVAPHVAACLPTHTCPDTAFTKVIRPDPPYHSRVDIDYHKVLAGRNLEIAWLAHPFDVYWFMLQGSGLLTFEDGSTQAVLFAGLNGHKGKSMAGYLIGTGQLSRRNADFKGMRSWWDNATVEQRKAFLEASSGYVFFRYGAMKPQGSIGSSLTPWVSMAVDQRVLPLGGILAYNLPTKGKKSLRPGHLVGKTSTLNGLGFAHDTGGAINLKRIDLYAGEGEKAHTQAKQVYTKGDVWLLLKKEQPAD